MTLLLASRTDRIARRVCRRTGNPRRAAPGEQRDLGPRHGGAARGPHDRALPRPAGTHPRGRTANGPRHTLHHPTGAAARNRRPRGDRSDRRRTGRPRFGGCPRGGPSPAARHPQLTSAGRGRRQALSARFAPQDSDLEPGIPPTVRSGGRLGFHRRLGHGRSALRLLRRAGPRASTQAEPAGTSRQSGGPAAPQDRPGQQ